MRNPTTKADMAKRSCIFDDISPAAVPFSYTIGGETYKGIPKFFRPTAERTSLDANITRYVISGVHPLGIEVRAEAQIYHDFAVTDWVASFKNVRPTPSPIVSDIRFVGEIPGEAPVLEWSNGDDRTDDCYTVYETALTDEVSVSGGTNDGLPCNGASPYMRLSFADYGVNMALGFPVGWNYEIRKTEGGASVSIGQSRCHMTILPGESIRAPRMTLQAYVGDATRGHNVWRQFYFAHIMPRVGGKIPSPKLCEHVYDIDGPEFTGTTEAKQLDGLKSYIDRGLKPDIWWLDAGWYPCNLNWQKVGTWNHDVARFPRGLAPIGDLCRESGVDFLLWFEPERVRENTEFFEMCREWLLDDSHASEDYLLYLGNAAACDFLIDYVCKKIEEYHVNIYRQDFNFSPTPYWNLHEAEDRIGAMENLHMQGYLRYWDTLLDRNPTLLIDSCAAGGKRNDLDAMRRAITLNYTDMGDGNHPIKQKQHKYMYEWIPYFRAHNKNWDTPEGEYSMNDHPVDCFAFHCALAPSLTNMTTYFGPEEQFEAGRVMVPIWRRAAALTLHADYYPLTECKGDPADWFAMQFDDPESGEGFVQIIRNIKVREDTFKLSMVVHDPEAQYFFENMETGMVVQMSGAELTEGVDFLLTPRSGQVWFYHVL